MEVIEIVEYNVNPKTNILEVTFRLMDDSEDMVREDKMDYSIAEEYGYNLEDETFEGEKLVLSKILVPEATVVTGEIFSLI